MMLTPEQLAELRKAIQEDTEKFEGASVSYPVPLRFMQDVIATFDAQQARIAELDGLLTSASNHCNATANERNDLRGQYASLLSLLADIRIACGDNGKRMQDELVAYISDLEQDAARYRYIFNGCTVLLPDGTECEDQQQLDAAMQK